MNEAPLEAVRRVLWERWDPIGVNRMTQIRDEYDSYAPYVLRQLMAGASDQDIAHHLATVETSSMGLSPPMALERRLAVAREIRSQLSALGVL